MDQVWENYYVFSYNRFIQFLMNQLYSSPFFMPAIILYK
jgi:hypothetical protein